MLAHTPAGFGEIDRRAAVCRLGAQLDRDPGHCPPSLLALGVTSIAQLVIVLISGTRPIARTR